MKTLFFQLTSLLLFFGLITYTAKAQPSSQPSTTSVARTVAIPGAKCRVVSGPNAGKEGTFDGEGSCCDEQNWGCTDCEDHGRWNNKCEFARVVVGGYVIGGISVVVYEGTYLVDNTRLVRCLTSVNQKTGKVVKTTCYVVPFQNFVDLRKSKNEIDKSIANAIDESLSTGVNTK